ncbi:dienelactone hydrolase family protein [Sphingopyxis flava]|nr:dienelactone hydrolase family protein [Sphingopyxis flava]
MAGQDLRYDAGGLSMVGSLHRPSQEGIAPGVLVFPEAFGFSSHATGKAARIANELGYVALACDLWGDRRELPGLADVTPAVEALASDAAALRCRVTSALVALRAQPGVDTTRIAAVGYCFGGTMAFELAACADIRAAVGIHSRLQFPSLDGGASGIKGRIMALLGADDPGNPPEVQESFARPLTEAGVDWEMTLYGGVVHSFSNPDAAEKGQPDMLRYDARADRRSWTQMASLFEEALA